MAFFVHVMFISILYKFGSRVIYFSLVAYSLSFGLVLLGWTVYLVRFVVQHIRLLSRVSCVCETSKSVCDNTKSACYQSFFVTICHVV